jgi:magnesium-transporting ATPase (P-type)
MLKFLQRNEFAIQDLLATRERAGRLETVIPFGPERKRSLVAVRQTANSNYIRVVVKGAPEYVLPKCASELGADGEA